MKLECDFMSECLVDMCDADAELGQAMYSFEMTVSRVLFHLFLKLILHFNG